MTNEEIEQKAREASTWCSCENCLKELVDFARSLVSQAYEEAINAACPLCAQGEEILHSSLIGYCHNVAVPVPAVFVSGDWHNGKEVCPASAIRALIDSLVQEPVSSSQ